MIHSKQAKIVAIRKINEMAVRRIPFVFVIDFLMEKPWVGTPEEAREAGILLEMKHFQNHTLAKKPLPTIQFDKYPLSFDHYLRAFGRVREQILYGNSYLINLSAPSHIQTNLSLQDIFIYSEAHIKLLFKDHFVCFSPEIFIQIRGRQIATFPMKGTIDASLNQAQELILNNPKEKAEHNTIVDLLRNDLNGIAKKVKVARYRYLDEIRSLDKNLLQVSSQITGELQENYRESLGEIIFSLLPAGSISGAPKKKTLEIILETENYERGFYTGIVGYFDGENLDSGVLIRFIENVAGTLYFKSGGGITYLSKPEDEYQELLYKVYLPICKA